MPNKNIHSNSDALFTLYFKEKEVVVNLSKQQLVNLIKESVELLGYSGEKQRMLEKKIGR